MTDTPLLPYQAHSPTSRSAAIRAEPTAGTLRAAVLAFIRDSGPSGATDEEIQDALALPGSTERPRRIECLTAGTIRDSGQVRATKSGRWAAVWVA